MTRQEILDMPAGRKLDALVAEKCLGIYSVIDDLRTPVDNYIYIKHYSTDLNAAWDSLAEKYMPYIDTGPVEDVAGQRTGVITEVIVRGQTVRDYKFCVSSEIATLICKAALLAELGL